MSKPWIPTGHRHVGAIFMNLDDNCGDAICGYENLEIMNAVCAECGAQTLMFTECIFSEKTNVREFMEKHALDERDYGASGDCCGDEICTCLSCGAVESGSSPFGLAQDLPVKE